MKNFFKLSVPLPVLYSLLIILLGAGTYLFILNSHLKSEIAKVTSDFGSQIDTLKKSLADLQNQNQTLQDSLINEKKVNDNFNDQISSISSTVGTLTKLSQTDKELLQKYSKVYFLNDNYIPSKLSIISGTLTYPENKEMYFHTNALPFLQRMLNDAKSQGLDLEILSAYRSFDSQARLKSTYKVTYGSGANKFSADQGYSEHQLGTTVDITTKTLGDTTESFEKTKEYDWLQKNAYKYGFVLSYPPKNTYYIFEPWHWRFVGVKLATTLHEDSKYFYDLDQRTIDKYLVDIFD